MNNRLTYEDFQKLDSESQERLLKALNARYSTGERPTYESRTFLNVPGQSRGQRVEGFTHHYCYQPEEKFSPLAVTWDQNRFEVRVVMAALSMRAIGQKIGKVSVPLQHAFDFDGFPEHLHQIAELVNAEFLDELRAKAIEEEERVAAIEREAMEERMSEEWGEL